MAHFNCDPTKQKDVLKQLLDLIEEIRYRRYEQWHHERHPLARKFTQFELTQVALPTYGNLLVGRSNRLPARQQLLELATYLECTVAETNDLLKCAQYLPEYEPLTDVEYTQAAERAKSIMRLIALPAVVMGKGGDGIEANEAFLQLNNLKPIHTWLPEKRNIIHTSFDPTFPSHQLFRVTTGTWQATAQGTIALLKSTAAPFQHESWFLGRLEKWKKLPEFNHYWNSVKAEADPFQEQVQAKMQTPLLQEPITEEATMIPFSKAFEVSLIVWHPVDDAARHVYQTLGCHIQDIRQNGTLADLKANIELRP